MGRLRLAAFIVGAATIAAATFACRQLVGIGNDPPQGPNAPSPDAGAEGGFTYGQGACEACVATSCTVQFFVRDGGVASFEALPTASP
jgi:hypothetical protein